MEDSTGKSGKYLDDFGLNYFWSKLKNLFSKKTNILDPEYIVRKDNDNSSIWSSKVTWEYQYGKYDYTKDLSGIIQLFTITKLDTGSFHYRAYYQSGLVREGSIIIEVCDRSDVVNSNKTVNTIFNIGDVPFVFNTTTNAVGLLEYTYNGDVDRKIYKIEGWFNLHTFNNAEVYLQSAIAPRVTALSNYSGATLYLDHIGDINSIDKYVDIPYHNLEGNNNPKVVYTFGDQTISGTKTFDYQSEIVVNGGATTTFNNTPTFTGGVVQFSAPPEYINGHIGASKDSHYFVTAGGLYDAIEGLQSGDIAGKQDTITGAASTAVSDNFTASRAVISNSSGKLGVSDVTSTELGYLDGVTSNVQTQLNSKQASITGGASTITSSNLTVSRALVSSSSGKVAVSDVTSTELSYLDGVTSNVQTQLNGKAESSDLDGYLPLSGGTVTGNIKQSNPMVNIGGGFVVNHYSSSEKIYKFFSITLNSSSYSQNQCFDITYATKLGGYSWGHLFIKTSQGSTVANASVTFYNRVDIGSNDNLFYYVRSSDTVVDFYYKTKDYSTLTLVDIKSGRQDTNEATFYKTEVSSLPSGAVQASRASFGGSTGSKGSSTVPIYINSSGQPTTCSTYAGGTSVTLNGTSKASTTASFYAPTTAGTSNHILTSNGSGAPSWKNSINVDVANFNAIELNKNGSTSLGHGGYIDFHYNASTEDYTSRIIDWNNRLAVMGKLLIQDGGLKYLGAGNDYTLTNTDGICFIRSDSANAITVPAGSGISNRHLYALSMVSGSTLTYHTYRISDFTIADVSLKMRPGKVYHLVAYDTNTWYLMNDVDNDNNGKTISVTSSSTLSDNYATKAKLSNGVTFSLSDATAYDGREILVYCNSTGVSPTVRWQVPAAADAYNSMTLSIFYCVKFIAIDGHWMPLQSSNI